MSGSERGECESSLGERWRGEGKGRGYINNIIIVSGTDILEQESPTDPYMSLNTYTHVRFEPCYS